MTYGTNSDRCCFVFWKSVDPGADAREGDGLDLVIHGQLKGVGITVGEVAFFVVLTTIPDWTHGMNNMPGRQVSTRGDDRFTGFASALPGDYFFTFFQNSGPARPVNCTIHASSPEEG